MRLPGHAGAAGRRAGGSAWAGQAALAVAAWLLAAAAGAAGAPVVAGRAEASYLLPDPGAVQSYTNQGFRQEIDDARLVVRVAAAGGWTRAAFELPAPPPTGDPVASFARAAAAGATTRAEAVARVVQAVAGSIAYRLGANLAERPEDVLARREASCVGLSNLAVAALRSLAIEARIARGLLFSPYSGQAVPHRWIEVFYPDAGWVFSDPTESINYVSAWHVVLTPPADPDPAYDPRAVQPITPRLVDSDDALMSVDLRPGRAAGLGERRIQSAQFAAAVVGRARPALAGRVRLSGAGHAWEQAVAPGGSFSFPGLPAGQYAIEASFGDSVRRMTVRVADAQVVEVEVKLK